MTNNNKHKNARATAAKLLGEWERRNAYADLLLKEMLEQAKLDVRDSALCSRIFYGVIQNRDYIDWRMQLVSTVKLRKMHPQLINIIRTGVYQLLFMDKIPISAAVNETVTLTKKAGHVRAAALVNAILRRISEQRDQAIWPGDIATRYSHPQQLVDLLTESIGKDQIEALLSANNSEPPMCVRVNTLKQTTEQAIDALEKSGIAVTRDKDLSECLYIERAGGIEQLDIFQNGNITIQDKAAMLAIRAAGLPLEYETDSDFLIIDVCAAPGGKSCYAAALTGGKGRIIACDIHPHKINIIAENARRLAAKNVEPMLWDARRHNPQWAAAADIVIADLPCSGLGVIRKKPDVRYNPIDKSEGLTSLQLKILKNAATYVKIKGTLVYSTCTLLRRENEDMIRAFLSQNDDFSLESFTIPLGGAVSASEGMLTLYPHIHNTDGFYICKMRRIK